MPRLKQERYDKVIQDYLSGLSQEETGIKNGLCRTAVGEILHRFNVEIREYTGERDSNKKWYWNTEYFNQRNPEVAYWAGFMMADGSLDDTGRSYSLVFYLQEKDREHLELFCSHIGLPVEAIYTMNVNKGEKEQYQYGIRLNHVGLPPQLLYWGIVPRKTYNFVESLVSDELLPHYLRGWADGDGQIYAQGTGSRFTISGNKESLEWYGKALKRLGFSGNVGYTSRNDIYGILYVGGQDQVKEILDLLQVEGNLKLERKWNVVHDNQYRKEIRICKYCGKEILVPVCFRDKRGFFCSIECSNKSRIKGKGKLYVGKENARKVFGKSNGSYYVYWFDPETLQRKDTTYAKWYWEMNNGAIPDGYLTSYKDGNRLNLDPSNIILKKRG